MKKSEYDVFISYSRKDYVDEHKDIIPGNEVSKIKEALSQAGITYWFDEDGVYSGDEFAKVIVKNIKASRVFVFLSSANSNQSEWTASEIASAHMLKKPIIPVRIDDSVYHDDVLLYISRLNHIDYEENPEKGRQELVRSINSVLAADELAEAQKKAEEDKKRQEQIGRIENEIAALETQQAGLEKVVLQKEQELKLARIDLKACEAKIARWQTKLERLRGQLRIQAEDVPRQQSVLKEQPVERENADPPSGQKLFASRKEVFKYVKANSYYPTSLSGRDTVKFIYWSDFRVKLQREYGLTVDRQGITVIKELVDRIWEATKQKKVVI